MAKNNTSPLGRLYQALRTEDLASAQKAALEMQPKTSGKNTTSTTAPKPATSTQTPAQKAQAALVNANLSLQESSVFALMGIGNNVNTVA